MSAIKNDVVIFLVITTIIILLLVGLIVLLIYLYQKKQITHQEKLEEIKYCHERHNLETRLEIQEDTFQHIAREIHDNINLSLTLAKLHLNTLDLQEKEKAAEQVNNAVDLLTQSIANLRDISRSLNSELVANSGLIKAIESEISRIHKTGLFEIELSVIGDPVYLDTQKELVIFRIVQEAFNNIIKHARATKCNVLLNYQDDLLEIQVSDNGVGFQLTNKEMPVQPGKAGLVNMRTRTKMIGGSMKIDSAALSGSLLQFKIPI